MVKVSGLVNQSCLAFFAHSTPARYRGGNLRAYLASTMNCGSRWVGQCMFYSSHTSLCQFTDHGDGRLAWTAGTKLPNHELCNGLHTGAYASSDCASPAHRQSMLSRDSVNVIGWPKIIKVFCLHIQFEITPLADWFLASSKQSVPAHIFLTVR